MKRTVPRAKSGLIPLVLLLLVATGCGSLTAPVSTPGSSVPIAPPAPEVGMPEVASPEIRHLTILYTNDEHGWIAPQQSDGGAAALLARWREVEGYSPDGPFLLLSGGDMWTGPAISSWFAGDSAVETMNAMGYRAAAIGNHEFDFGLEVLRRHVEESDFPYLSANIVRKETGQPPDFAQSYAILDVDGIKVGVIGLTTRRTPGITSPEFTGDLDFVPHLQTLERYAPEVDAAGADLIIALAHVCGDEMRALAAPAKALGVDVLTAGHCHEQLTGAPEGLPLIGGGQFMRSYARLDLDINLTTNTVVSQQAQVIDNVLPASILPDAQLAASVAGWQKKTDAALGEIIGHTRIGLGHRSEALFNLVTDAWLWAYPNADLAITNLGGFRQGIDPGPITMSDIVGVLPFDNTLVEVTITGAQVQENLDCCSGAIAGMAYLGSIIKLPDETPLMPDARYRVLINSFIAAGGDDYRFSQQSPDHYDTGINWRQPVIDYLKALGTTGADPLENYLGDDRRLAP